MKSQALFLLIIFLIFGCKEKAPEPSRPITKKIEIGVVDSIQSDILGEKRTLWVYTPDDTTKKYPWLLLLDGDGHFQSVTGLVHQLSTINGNTVLPEMVIVGITNTDRTRDLTPTHVDHVFGDSTFAKTSGGAPNFTKFIKEELIPHVEKNYPASSYRTLAGHSFGGLFAMHALYTEPELFANYLAIDPSMWWDDQKLVKEAVQVMGNKALSNKSLFVAVANTMNKGMKVETVGADTSEATIQIRSILNLNNELSKLKNGLSFKWKYYDEDDHGSVPLIAEHDGLRFFFSWHSLKGVNDLFDKNSKATPQEMLATVQGHYKNVSSRFGYEVLPPESLINGMGYNFMMLGMNDKAFACFDLNIKNYPKSANVFDSMGDYYIAEKDTTKALENFEHALTLAKLDYTIDKLSKIKEARKK